MLRYCVVVVLLLIRLTYSRFLAGISPYGFIWFDIGCDNCACANDCVMAYSHMI
jgi:hypothetical protein